MAAKMTPKTGATMTEQMQCLLVNKRADGKIERAVRACDTSELPEGEVLVRVAYSSLNYKDALAATGHPGVVSKFPHVAGHRRGLVFIAGDLPDRLLVIR